jgi:hypothetical protein
MLRFGMLMLILRCGVGILAHHHLMDLQHRHGAIWLLRQRQRLPMLGDQRRVERRFPATGCGKNQRRTNGEQGEYKAVHAILVNLESLASF